MRDWDFFAIPVGMTYKGQREFNTVFGGCLSIILGVLFAIIGTTLLISVVETPQYSNDIYVTY